MNNRDFSDSIKLSVIKDNIKRNNGDISCEICRKKLLSINECHFDHIIPYSKGGKSSLDNCQILCINCNLKKTDKELNDFLLEKKALEFFSGETIKNQNTENIDQKSNNDNNIKTNLMTKDLFDEKVSKFISLKGDIHKVDFSREYNDLPSVHYVKRYYGDLKSLKKAFGINDLSLSWNRDSIKESLQNYVDANGDIFQKDLSKRNKLPSLPCVLNYYPEYKSFTDIKKNMLNLSVKNSWDRESVIKAGKEYVKNHGKITETCLRSKNNLPTLQIIYRYFPSLNDYQKEVGSEVSKKNEFISKESIEFEVNNFFKDSERVIESKKIFFDSFPYSVSTIEKRYGSFPKFCEIYGITVINTKKAKYTKPEVDNAISKWVKNNKRIPLAKDLSKYGLPSMSVILKYYENWKEPFVLYLKLYDKLN